MRYALMTEPQQGLSYAELLDLARAAEAAGLEAFFRSDHYASFPGAAGLPTTDAWATLAGLARETTSIHLGTLVSPITFRIPGSFAKLVATVDEMSGGRLEVGMGAGWNDEEHAQLGIPFPSLGERYDQLEEGLAVVHGLWTEPDGWSFAGRHWRVHDALFRPRPTRSGGRHPHLILGGDGGPRLARLVATWADEFNRQSATPARLTEAYGRVRTACQAIGRDPDSLVYSAMVGVLVAETTAEVRDRVRALLSMIGSSDDADAWLAERGDRWIVGTPEEAHERIEALAAAGCERIMFQDFLPRDLEMVGLLGRMAAG
ncbi:MAG TPA: TIGR03560 family F420-dependent LLM class oxidoreductase [Candidatus Saccharimonadales bacterium]|nr:TIGR03560 family F420-dependent LLM class oxidoreductase [Candidatus Saccharimonadales bacterium]